LLHFDQLFNVVIGLLHADQVGQPTFGQLEQSGHAELDVVPFREVVLHYGLPIGVLGNLSQLSDLVLFVSLVPEAVSHEEESFYFEVGCLLGKIDGFYE